MIGNPSDITVGIGTGIPADLISNLIVYFLIELYKARKAIPDQPPDFGRPIRCANLEDFWEAYKKQEIKEGDSVSIRGVFSDLGLAMPASKPDEAVHATKNSLEELLQCFSDDSDLDLQEQIIKFDAQIDMLRFQLGSCMRLPLIKGLKYCNLFDEDDIIPVKGLPLFVRKNIRMSSPLFSGRSSPFYGRVTGYVTEIPSYWKGILKVGSKKPVAITVDGDAGGKLERQRDLDNPLYLSYWIVFRYRNGDGCIVAARGDYSNKKNYKACREFLKTIADVEIKKLNAHLLSEYDQVNRLTQYKQVLNENQIDEILKTGRPQKVSSPIG